MGGAVSGLRLALVLITVRGCLGFVNTVGLCTRFIAYFVECCWWVCLVCGLIVSYLLFCSFVVVLTLLLLYLVLFVGLLW